MKDLIKKISTVYAAAVMGATLTAAASVSAGEVRFVVAEYSSKTGPYFEAAAAAFEQAHPETDIQIEVVPWDVLRQKLDTDIFGGQAPDLAIVGTRWLIDFVEEDLVVNLDRYMDDAFRGRFFKAFLTPSEMKDGNYGLPVAASARAMFYNKALLSGAGYQGAPATWKDLMDASAKIKAQGNIGFAMQGKEIETDVYYYYALWAHGGSILKADGTSGLDSEAALRAANLYKNLITAGLTQDGVTAANRQDVEGLFKEGRAGMIISAPYMINQIKEENPGLEYGVAPIPSAGSQGTYGVTDSVVMFEGSQVKDEAWQFLNFIFGDEWRAKFTLGEGFLPVNKSVAQLPEIADNEKMAAFAEVLADARFAPVLPGWEEVAEVTTRALQRIYLGEGEAETELSAAAAEVNRILGK